MIDSAHEGRRWVPPCVLVPHQNPKTPPTLCVPTIHTHLPDLYNVICIFLHCSKYYFNLILYRHLRSSVYIYFIIAFFSVLQSGIFYCIVYTILYHPDKIKRSGRTGPQLHRHTSSTIHVRVCAYIFIYILFFSLNKLL